MFAILQKYLKFLATVVVVASTSQIAKSDDPVSVWSHYDFPPFVTGENEGFLFDLVEMLNDTGEGKFIFQASIIPRKRLDLYIEKGRQAIVPFVHWSYMGDKEKIKYYWSPVLLNDQNEFVSRASSPVEFDGTMASLTGLRFGSVLGHRYVDMAEAIDSGKIIRVDTGGEDKALLMLMAGRTDFTTMSKPVLNYYLEKNNLEDRIHISTIPRSKFTRHFMVTKGLEEEYRFLLKFMETTNSSPIWLEMLKKHGY